MTRITPGDYFERGKRYWSQRVNGNSEPPPAREAWIDFLDADGNAICGGPVTLVQNDRGIWKNADAIGWPISRRAGARTVRVTSQDSVQTFPIADEEGIA